MEIENFFGPIDIAISGIKAQGRQMELISSNVANARTTDDGKGVPYRRLEAALKYDDEIGGVEVDKIETDMSDFLRIYDPGNPQADKDGYIAMPNVNLPQEMINLNIATRVYQVNVAVLKRYQRMVDNTLELLR
jgi:flagellar basal-body rod protein FlgC